jgi:hypothetical protein
LQNDAKSYWLLVVGYELCIGELHPTATKGTSLERETGARFSPNGTNDIQHANG